MVSGTTENTAAKSHNVTEPGPTWAAIGSHRTEITQPMAKSVRSRKPSSRLSAAAGCFAEGGAEPLALQFPKPPQGETVLWEKTEKIR